MKYPDFDGNKGSYLTSGRLLSRLGMTYERTLRRNYVGIAKHTKGISSAI